MFYLLPAADAGIVKPVMVNWIAIYDDIAVFNEARLYSPDFSLIRARKLGNPGYNGAF